MGTAAASNEDTIDTAGFDLIAACAFGLEAVVKRELELLGISARIEGSGRVHFRGTHETIAQTNLWLRVADRILIRVAQFPAADFDALFDTTRDLPWAKWLPVDAAFPVTGRSIQSQLSSVPACQRSVKRAIVDAMLREHGTSELTEAGAQYKIDIALLKDVATLTIDTTGRSLHRRGYRTDVSRAPLKETLAAALVLLSYWRPDRPLLDPFCGSGTIPIEAARIGRNLPPGMDRRFAFEHWHGLDADVLSDLRSTAATQAIDSIDEKLIGRDIDGRVLRAARDNAQRAGVADSIHFEVGDAREATSKRRFGCLIANPPYGQRLGGDQGYRGRRDYELDDLYGSLPNVLRKFPTWSHYVLTAYPGFERAVGRQADRRRKLYNGRIECTYFQFHGPKPVVEHRAVDDNANSDGDLAPRVLVHAEGDAAFGTLDAKANEQAELFAARLRKRAKHLRRWPTKRGISCFRIYERDVPEIPLVVDRYENHLHITEYERPHDRDPAQHANWLDLMARTAAETLEVLPQRVHMKTRLRQKGKRQHEKLDHSGNTLEVHEGGLKFLVNLKDYVDTGLFLDHRVTRQMVRDQAEGKRMLNLFCYTGSFSVYAAAGGARSTTSVDLSKNYLDWAWQNMRLNDFDGNQHRFVTSDVREFIRQHPPGEHYDLVVLDPPTFSNSKRTDQDWDVQHDATRLLLDLLPLLSDEGVVYFSTNFRRFKFDGQSLPECRVHEISRQTVPEDFRNRRIHRCWRIAKSSSK